MSDVRHCDGPDCNVSAPLNGEAASRVSDLTAENFITVERRWLIDLHFHDQDCLTNWSERETGRAK